MDTQCTLDFRARLWRFVFIKPREHCRGQALMLSEVSWGALSVSVQLRSELCASHSSSSTPTLVKHEVLMFLALCTVELSCLNKLRCLVSINANCNVTAYNDTLHNCLLATLWEEKKQQNGVRVRCPQTSVYIMYVWCFLFVCISTRSKVIVIKKGERFHSKSTQGHSAISTFLITINTYGEILLPNELN